MESNPLAQMQGSEIDMKASAIKSLQDRTNVLQEELLMVHSKLSADMLEAETKHNAEKRKLLNDIKWAKSVCTSLETKVKKRDENDFSVSWPGCSFTPLLRRKFLG